MKKVNWRNQIEKKDYFPTTDKDIRESKDEKDWYIREEFEDEQRREERTPIEKARLFLLSRMI